MRDGRPTGVYEDFLTGFVADNNSVLGTARRRRGGPRRIAAGDRRWEQHDLARVVPEVKRPTVHGPVFVPVRRVSVVYHLSGHAAIHYKVLSGDETG